MPHADLTEVTGVELVEVGAVVVLNTLSRVYRQQSRPSKRVSDDFEVHSVVVPDHRPYRDHRGASCA